MCDVQADLRGRAQPCPRQDGQAHCCPLQVWVSYILEFLSRGAFLAIYVECVPACTANEGPVRIQLVAIYVFPEMKLCSLLISKTEL